MDVEKKKWKYSMLMEFGTMQGWLSSYNFETGKWIVQFYEDIIIMKQLK